MLEVYKPFLIECIQICWNCTKNVNILKINKYSVKIENYKKTQVRKCTKIG